MLRFGPKLSSAAVGFPLLLAGASGLLGAEADRVSIWSIQSAVDELAEEAERVREELKELPELEDTLQMDAYGYHSDYLPALGKFPDEPRWVVTVPVSHKGLASEVYLVPAADRRDPEMPGYGFPKRFRIVGVATDGRTDLLVDWREKDFPNPGRLPVRLPFVESRYATLRIEVFQGRIEANKEFFALDEVMVRANFFLRRMDAVEVSGSFEAPPFWSPQYLVDEKTSLGLPVRARPNRVEGARDFVLRFEERRAEPLVIELDLKENRKNGELVLYPAQAPEGIFVPGYGYPRRLSVALYQETGIPGERKLAIERAVPEIGDPGNNIVRLVLSGREGRWLRLAFDDLREYEGKPIFGLGEIEVTEARESVSIGARASSESLSPEDNERLQLLTDGLAGGRGVVSLLPWLDGLSERRDLNAELARIEASRSELEARWSRLKERSLSFGLGGAALLLAGIVVGGVLIQRRRLRALKRRISRDLHDEVGSSLGSVRLTAERLQQDISDTAAKRDLEDLALLAREASSSLLDVVWVFDRNEIRLSELMRNLRQRAERVLGGIELEFESSLEGADEVVPLGVKRHIVMFFKEAVHNCIRHSGATKVRIRIAADRRAFSLELSDNGCGFDPEKRGSGWGIESMEDRAAELGGSLSLRSAPGEGTMVALSVGMKSLLSATGSHYKSSN